jgi:hypothetical protein
MSLKAAGIAVFLPIGLQIPLMSNSAPGGWDDGRLDAVLELAKAAVLEAGLVVTRAWGPGHSKLCNILCGVNNV